MWAVQVGTVVFAVGVWSTSVRADDTTSSTSVGRGDIHGVVSQGARDIDAAVVKFVTEHRGAIGYVSSAASSGNAKVIQPK